MPNPHMHRQLIWLLLIVLALPLQVTVASARQPAAPVAELVDRINARDHDYLGSRMNHQHVLETIMQGLEVSESMDALLRAQYIDKIAPAFGESMVVNFPEGYQAHWSTTLYGEQTEEAVIRVDLGDSGYSYLRMIYRKNAAGQWVINDWFDYARGQYLTESLHQIYSQYAPPSGLGDSLAEVFNGKRNKRQLASKLFPLMRDGDYQGLVALFDDHQAILKEDWLLLTLFSSAAIRLEDESDYKRILEFVEAHFGDDPRASFILLDYHAYREDHSAMLRILDVLSEEFNHRDAAITLMQAQGHADLEQWEQALERGLTSIQQERDFEDAYLALVDFSVMANRPRQAVIHLNQLIDRFDYEFDTEVMESDPFFADFIKTRDYRDWKQGHLEATEYD